LALPPRLLVAGGIAWAAMPSNSVKVETVTEGHRHVADAESDVALINYVGTLPTARCSTRASSAAAALSKP
jgi:hypothetical protein